MTQQDILTEIRADLPISKENLGVSRIGLFGSYAKGQNRLESDVDFLVALNPPYAKHYFNLLFFLVRKFEKKIDLIRRGKHLSTKFIRHVENEIVYA